jgi:hypothetical protein
MRTEQNLQVVNAIAQKNFNPVLLEKHSGFGGIGLVCEKNGNLIQKLKSKLEELPKNLLQALNVMK